MAAHESTDRAARQYDLSLRPIARDRPEDFVQFVVGPDARLVELIDPNLPASERVADFLAVVEHPTHGQLLLHLEFQTIFEPGIAFRMLEYRVRTAVRHPALSDRIYSVVMYLSDERYPGPGYNRLEETVLGEAQLRFSFHEIRLWELPAETMLADGPLGLLPLLPLMAGATPAMLQTAVERITAVPDEQTRSDCLVGLSVLGEIRFPREVLDRLIRREAMRPSQFIEEWRKEGREEGRQKGLAEGREEGQLLEAREAVLLVLRKRFRRISKKVEASLESIRELSELRSLQAHALDCEDLKAFTAALPH